MIPTLTRTLKAGALTVLAGVSPWALAHMDGSLHSADHDSWFSSLSAGFTHPFTGADHLLAMAAVGFWAATMVGRADTQSTAWRTWWKAPAAFVLMLVLGAAASVAGWVTPAIEPMIALSVLVLGLLIASRMALSVTLGAVLVGAFAVFHGAAHGQELHGQAFAALTGMAAGTLVLHGMGVALATGVERLPVQVRNWTPRLMGLCMSAIGLGMLAKTI